MTPETAMAPAVIKQPVEAFFASSVGRDSGAAAALKIGIKAITGRIMMAGSSSSNWE